MKVWMFYLNDRELYEKYKNMSLVPEDYDGTGKKPLYAYTNDKLLAKGFRKTRNMKRFKEKVFHLDEDELKELDDQFYFSSKLTIGEVKYAEEKTAPIVLTTSEHWLIVENPRETIGEIELGLKLPPIRIFTPKIRSLLKVIKYEAFNEGNIDVDDPYEQFPEIMRRYNKKYERFSKIISKGYGENQLGLLLYLFKEIFNIESLCEEINHENK